MKKYNKFVMMCFLPISILMAEERVGDMESMTNEHPPIDMSQEDLNSTSMEPSKEIELEIVNGTVQRKVSHNEQYKETVDVDAEDNMESVSEKEI